MLKKRNYGMEKLKTGLRLAKRILRVTAAVVFAVVCGFGVACKDGAGCGVRLETGGYGCGKNCLWLCEKVP